MVDKREGGVVRRFNIYLIVLLILLLLPLTGCVHTRSALSRVQGASDVRHLEVHFIDVGQGEAILIRSPSNETILIDAGPLSSGYKVTHYLEKLNIKKIDRMIVTHMHQDHAGGLFHFLPQLQVETLYDNGADLSGNDIYEEYLIIVRSLGIQRKTLKFGDRLQLNDLTLDVVSPIDKLSGDLNADSIVIRLRYGDINFLLAADLTKNGEKKIMDKGVHLKSHVLKVGHHGACDATSETFLDAVRPDIAVLTVSKENRFGYPCKEVLQLLKKKNIRMIRTDLFGTVVIRSDGNQIWICDNP